jgi:hypothetical protein
MKNVNHTIYQKEAYYTGIKLFNNLLSPVTRLNYDIKPFKQ